MNKTSGKPKRKLEKFLNTSGSREKKNKTISKLNISNIKKDTSPNNSSEKKRYKYEYTNIKRDYMNNISTIKNNEEEKNIIGGLIKEGLISLDEPEFDENKIEIRNLKYKEINLEKIFQKLLFLNKSLKNTQTERKKLENEQNTFLDAVNENKKSNESKNIDKNNNIDNVKNNIKDIKAELIQKENNGDNFDNKKFNEILKRYEEDLKFFGDLIITNNNYEEFK